MATNNAVNTSLSGQTGTGSFAGSTSPSFTTPILGTPTSGNLSNCTNYPFSALSGSITAAQLIALGNSGVSVIGAVTYDLTTASGTQTITGLAFQPSLVLFFTNVNAASPMSIGIDNLAAQRLCVYDNNGASANTYGNLSSDSIVMVTGVGASQAGHISSFTADGFIITWTKTGAPSGTADIRFLAFK